MLSQALYTFESNTRSATILGVVGAGGIGLALSDRIRKMNPRAPIKHVHFGNAPIAEVLDIRGFNLNAILELEPDFLTDSAHEHHDEVESFVYRTAQAFDGAKLEQFLGGLIQGHRDDLVLTTKCFNPVSTDINANTIFRRQFIAAFMFA